MTRRLRAVLLLLSIAPALGAQVADSTHTDKGVPTSVISLNPFLLVVPILTGDFEHTISPAFTFGIGATLSRVKEWNNYTVLDAKLRFYPGETALRGFSIAGILGVATAKGDVSYPVYTSYAPDVDASGRVTKVTFGTELSYQWLLGPKQNFAIALGLGVKRFIGGGSYLFPIETEVMPTARISIGVAF